MPRFLFSEQFADFRGTLSEVRSDHICMKRIAINAITDAPSVPGSFVHVETGERYADRAEEFVDAQEVAVQGGEDDLRGVTLFRNQQLAFLVPFYVLGSLLLHGRLVLFLTQSDRHEAIVGLCARFIVSACRRSNESRNGN